MKAEKKQLTLLLVKEEYSKGEVVIYEGDASL